MKLKINGIELEVSGGTILEAARANGIDIPTLCYLKDVNKIGACRICLVEVTGMRGPVPACATNVSEGMEVFTDTPAIRESRKKTLELMCSNHEMSCTECVRGMDCRLRDLCKEYGVDDSFYGKGHRESMKDESTPYLVRDNAKCVLCRRCASVCKNFQGISAIGINFKGAKTNVGFGISLSETECVGCGQCISVCPTGALSEKDDTKLAWKALLRRGNTNTAVAVVTAQVCMQIGELLGEATGTDCSGKVAAMLRRMGYKKVYKLSGVIGVCPAWRKYLMYKHPERAASLPDDVQPWESFAASYKALDSNTDITAFTPCLAAKASYSGDLTAVLTTRELVSMWKRACVSNFTALDVWSELPEESFDELPFSVESTSSPAVVTGLVSAEKMLTEGTLKDLTAARACPGGCIMGGGAPAFKESDRNVTFALRSK